RTACSGIGDRSRCNLTDTAACVLRTVRYESSRTVGILSDRPLPHLASAAIGNLHASSGSWATGAVLGDVVLQDVVQSDPIHWVGNTSAITGRGSGASIHS